VALLGVATLVGAGTGLTEGGSAAVLVTAACALTLVAGLIGDAWFGLLAGLVAAAGLTLLRQLSGSWLPDHFAPAAIETAALLAIGSAAGWVGNLLRARGLAGAASTEDVPGVFGSLGMLSADLATLRLEEEVARATTYARPLSLMLIEVKVADQDLDAGARGEVYRTVARLAESLLRETDVPFASADERIGAILPETDHVAALIALGRILEAIAEATYTDRHESRRGRVADVGEVRMGVVSLGDTFRTAVELLDGATASLLHRVPGA
jgi:hypothetical protein